MYHLGIMVIERGAIPVLDTLLVNNFSYIAISQTFSVLDHLL